MLLGHLSFTDAARLAYHGLLLRGCFASFASALVTAPLEVGRVLASWFGAAASIAHFELLAISFITGFASHADAAVAAPIKKSDA